MHTENHNFTATLDCRYLLRVPEHVTGTTPLVVAVHGYGMNAKLMLRLTSRMVGDDAVLASIEAPNQYHLSRPGPDAEVGYHWGTREHWASSIRLHHEMVLRVLHDVRQRFEIPAARSILVGFSQPVGLNYRFAATWKEEVRGVIGVCGGVPKDWEQRDYGPVPAALLHIAREEDEFYPADVARGFPDRLRVYAADVEFHMLPGAHRFPSQAGEMVRAWIRRVCG